MSRERVGRSLIAGASKASPACLSYCTESVPACLGAVMKVTIKCYLRDSPAYHFNSLHVLLIHCRVSGMRGDVQRPPWVLDGITLCITRRLQRSSKLQIEFFVAEPGIKLLTSASTCELVLQQPRRVVDVEEIEETMTFVVQNSEGFGSVQIRVTDSAYTLPLGSAFTGLLTRLCLLMKCGLEVLIST